METERVGRAGPTRLLFVPFRDGGDVVGYPLGHAPPAASMWRGVFFGMLFCTTAVVVETRNANDSDGGGNKDARRLGELGELEELEELERLLIRRRAERVTRETELEQLLISAKSGAGDHDDHDDGPGEEECVGEECWDIARQAVFAERASQSLPTAPRPTDADVASEPTDIASEPTDPASDEGRTRTGGKRIGDDGYHDITQRLFPEGRRGGPKSSRPSAFQDEDKSEMNSRQRAFRASALYQKLRESPSSSSPSSSSPPSSPPSEGSRTTEYEKAKEAYYDITQSYFPDLWSSSFGDGEKSEMNSRRPLDRVMPGWTSANAGSGRRSDRDGRNEDGDRVGVARERFPEDRDPFASGASSDAGGRGATAGPREGDGQVRRDVARNFSQDRESLRGHPRSRKVDGAAKGADDDVHLDTNRFPSDLAPPSPRTAASANAARRADSSAVKHEKYLEKPRASAKGIDAAGRVGDGGDGRPDPGGVPLPTQKGQGLRVTEADKYLDTNQFSWNLSPSSAGGSGAPSSPAPATPGKAPFLDTPRAFRPGVDMVSSNTSGRRAKRSSDVAPEDKQGVRDRYGIATARMSSIDDMGQSRKAFTTGRPASRPKRASGGGEYFDITRAPMSRIQRASSAIRDAGGASGARPSDPAESGDDDAGGDRPSSSGEESASYEGVMHWLLTYLPQLQEEDAISYFNCLLEDGFDSIGMLGEVLEEDLYFMKRGHQRTLLRDIRGDDGGVLTTGDDEDRRDFVEDETYVDGKTAPSETLGDTIDRTKAEREGTEASIERNRPTEERPSARSSAGEGAATGRAVPDDKEASVAADEPGRAGAAKRNDDDEFQDIARGSFAESAAPARGESPPSGEGGEGPGSGAPGGGDAAPLDDARRIDAGGVAPRAELHRYYVKERRLTSARAQELKDYYTTWTNDAKSHESKFTCIFTCPLTGEHFACGDWSNNGGAGAVDAEDETFWYSESRSVPCSCGLLFFAPFRRSHRCGFSFSPSSFRFSSREQKGGDECGRGKSPGLLLPPRVPRNGSGARETMSRCTVPVRRGCSRPSDPAGRNRFTNGAHSSGRFIVRDRHLLSNCIGYQLDGVPHASKCM